MQVLSAVLCALLATHAIAPCALAQTMPAQLNLVIVKGDGAQDPVGQRVATPPAVRVEDEQHKPVANAIVVFTLPTEGSTGEFGNHSKSLTVTTDGEGLAVAKGMRTNEVPGKVPIHINVSYRGLSARGSMMQFNVGPANGKRGGGGGGGKVALILLLVAGAAGGGAYAYLRTTKQGPTSTASVPSGPSPIGITPGTGTVGAPN